MSIFRSADKTVEIDPAGRADRLGRLDGRSEESPRPFPVLFIVLTGGMIAIQRLADSEVLAAYAALTARSDIGNREAPTEKSLEQEAIRLVSGCSLRSGVSGTWLWIENPELSPSCEPPAVSLPALTRPFGCGGGRGRPPPGREVRGGGGGGGGGRGEAGKEKRKGGGDRRKNVRLSRHTRRQASVLLPSYHSFSAGLIGF